MTRAYIIGESMRPDSSLANLRATLVQVARDTVTNAATNQPKMWTTITFDTALEPEQLAARFSEILNDRPACWYTHFRVGHEMFVIFPHKVMRYPAGDKAGKKDAQDYARSIGVPGSQIDWEES